MVLSTRDSWSPPEESELTNDCLHHSKWCSFNIKKNPLSTQIRYNKRTSQGYELDGGDPCFGSRGMGTANTR